MSHMSETFQVTSLAAPGPSLIHLHENYMLSFSFTPEYSYIGYTHIILGVSLIKAGSYFFAVVKIAAVNISLW